MCNQENFKQTLEKIKQYYDGLYTRRIIEAVAVLQGR
jgi:hypothetical protein